MTTEADKSTKRRSLFCAVNELKVGDVLDWGSTTSKVLTVLPADVHMCIIMHQVEVPGLPPTRLQLHPTMSLLRFSPDPTMEPAA